MTSRMIGTGFPASLFRASSRNGITRTEKILSQTYLEIIAPRSTRKETEEKKTDLRWPQWNARVLPDTRCAKCNFAQRLLSRETYPEYSSNMLDSQLLIT